MAYQNIESQIEEYDRNTWIELVELLKIGQLLRTRYHSNVHFRAGNGFNGAANCQRCSLWLIHSFLYKWNPSWSANLWLQKCLK